MLRLPLYPGDQRTPVEQETALPYDPVCVRCNLGNVRHTVCAPPTGTGVGGVLVVTDQLTSEEEKAGKQGQATIHKLVAGRVHAALNRGPFIMDTAVKCHMGSGQKPAQEDAILQACRGYLWQTMVDVKPTRIIACGPRAVESILGRSPYLQAVRRGYGWIWDAPWAAPVTLADGRVVRPVPVFLVMHPGMSHANLFVKKWLDEDIRWACTTPVPTIPPWDVWTEVIENGEDAREAALEIQGAGSWISLDVETAGRMHSGELRVVSISLSLSGTTKSWVWDRDALADPEAFEELAAILEDPTVGKVGQNIKFDLQAINQGLGIEVQGLHGDIRIWRKLLDSDAMADLETMQELIGMGGGKDEMEAALEEKVKEVQKKAQAIKKEICKAHPDIDQALQGQKEQIELLLSQFSNRLTKEQKTHLWRGYSPRAYVYGEVDTSLLSRYNARDSVSTTLIGELEQKTLLPNDLMFAWEALFGPATEALVQVETWGFAADVQKFRTLSKLFGARMEAIKKRVAAYGAFDINSPASVAELLFKTLKLHSTKLSKKTGKPSTDHASLEALRGQHPVVDDILEYRGIAKLKSQYADGMILHISPDGRIHTTYKVDGARSGRASSENPNMQNIPNEEKGPDSKLIKDCFIARPGYKLLAADYAQLEFRIAADLSDDPEMKKVFESGVDFHQATAEFIAPIVWKITPCPKCKDNHCHVTKRHRGAAKSFNFGIMYGMQDGAIAARAGCDYNTAKAIRQAVLGKFRKFAAWIQQCLAYTRKHGIAWTYWDGRKAYQRQLWKILDADDGQRINAENSTYNTPVQGTASFFCLASVTAMVRWILRNRIDAKVVATVHDSIVLEVREDLLLMVARKLRKVMMSHKTITGVPLDVDVKAGYAWGSLTEEITPEQEAAAILGGPEAAEAVRADQMGYGEPS